MVMRLSDRVLAMDEGRRSRRPAGGRARPTGGRRAYLGPCAVGADDDASGSRDMSASPVLELDRDRLLLRPIQVHFDLSIAVPEGKIVCLLGGNASGKSTAMKVILGL